MQCAVSFKYSAASAVQQVSLNYAVYTDNVGEFNPFFCPELYKKGRKKLKMEELLYWPNSKKYKVCQWNQYFSIAFKYCSTWDWNR